MALTPEHSDHRSARQADLPPLGARIRCQRDRPTKGTWSRYAGKRGTVVGYSSDPLAPEMVVKLDGGSVVWLAADEWGPATADRSL